MTIAWAVLQPDSYKVFLTYDEAVNLREECAGGEIVPLIRITDEEIEAIDWAEMDAILQAAHETTADQIPVWEKRAAILRNLLERIKDK
jgi:hypothetical protein